MLFWDFGKKMDVGLVEDHLVMRWGKRKHQVQEFFRVLVLDEGMGLPDDEVKKGLRRMFFGSADFMQRMHETYGQLQ